MTHPPTPIRVLIVDDSALVRKVLREILSAYPDIEVVGAAPDPLFAREMIKALHPDVLTLDVEMPRMDGLDFLGRLMRLRPMPVVMVSSLTEKGSDITLQALALGAVDFIAKPRLDVGRGLTAYADALAEKIRIAAASRVRRLAKVGQRHSADVILPPVAHRLISSEKLIVIGASTGGTEAIADILVRLPDDCPAILIAQHMPAGFTTSFARRLDGLCRVCVKEAEHGERILPGHAYIAPGGLHLLLARSGANYQAELSDGPPVNRHRPSVDVLFRSAANFAGRNAIGVILTGMGDDGAAGLLEMRSQGAHTIAQDEASCVVYGMPHAAVALGGAVEEAALSDIPERIMSALTHSASTSSVSNASRVPPPILFKNSRVP